jgi:hypothetical protein
MLFLLVQVCYTIRFCNSIISKLCHPVEMFKVRMQGQYGAVTDKKLRDVAKEMWRDWGFRNGVMRGYWVSAVIVSCRKFG